MCDPICVVQFCSLIQIVLSYPANRIPFDLPSSFPTYQGKIKATLLTGYSVVQCCCPALKQTGLLLPGCPILFITHTITTEWIGLHSTLIPLPILCELKCLLRFFIWDCCCCLICFSFFVQLILTLSIALAESRRTTNYVVLFKITSETFSVELKDKKSPSFKSLAYGLEFEVRISNSTLVVNNLFCSLSDDTLHFLAS